MPALHTRAVSCKGGRREVKNTAPCVMQINKLSVIQQQPNPIIAACEGCKAKYCVLISFAILPALSLRGGQHHVLPLRDAGAHGLYSKQQATTTTSFK